MIYDVGNGMRGGSPSNPQLVSGIITSTDNVPGGPQVHNAWWFHNPVSGENRYLFVGQEGPSSALGGTASGDIHIVDVSNLAAPVEVGGIHISGAGTHNFWMDEANQVLYAAYYDAGVVKIDVSGVLNGDMSNRIVKTTSLGAPGTFYTWGVMLSPGHPLCHRHADWLLGTRSGHARHQGRRQQRAGAVWFGSVGGGQYGV